MGTLTRRDREYCHRSDVTAVEAHYVDEVVEN
jgi:hypothetical protein